ncbi:MAG: phosphoribosylaminoimidazolecarboxamide formyltransferase [Chloroflexi bacterium]|nr:phosphoribosylaminoimidazolecarboxamide formyltransferase [Chloroflexota bacterium]MCY3587259.1 phosphoribosylaminoimidazolecarboxamide formyltransferase [Chloroflexota bacterium]MCY3686246.1 phosphoribosylaminoimidazolecarboxamide formyltransferase [Chloroflexota bacterium]MDE2708867.1 phosphoribosylaminoimidazolecarboxamide formyltransferase [Chloroflexota bacterium]
MSDPIPLRYGINPHQAPATAAAITEWPFEVLNGQPGYINLLDALSSWNLVVELRNALDQPAAASFKHVSPAGAAIGLPIGDRLARAYEVEKLELSPVASAYVRARGGDLVSAYGDFAAVSDVVDESLARFLRREVSDGIIAPGFEPAALEILQRKKGGRYLILQADPDADTPPVESRDHFGIRLEQPLDRKLIDSSIFGNPVTELTDFPADVRRDLMIATIALRYTQSNSVCVAADGQVIGLGAGQQSRIHCSRLACGKADRWMLQQHDRVLGLEFDSSFKRPDRFAGREQYIAWNELSEPERERLQSQIVNWSGPLSADSRRDWIERFQTVLSHDAFMPFRDNVDRAQASAVTHILQPGGSIADADTTDACNQYGIVMALTGQRLFRH